MVAPWIMVDELVYSELAKSFADARRVPRPRRAEQRLRLRLPGADRAGLAALRRGARRLRRREGDQRASSCRSPRCPAYFLARRLLAPRARARRRGAHRARAVDALHRHADDRERVLPALPASSRSRSSRRSSGRRRCARSSLLALCGARVRDARAGGRARRRGRDGAAAARARRAARLPRAAAAVRDALRDPRRRRRCSRCSARSRAAARRSTLLGAYRAATGERLHRRRRPRTSSSTTSAELDLYLGVLPFAALLALWLAPRDADARRARVRRRARSRSSCWLAARGRGVRVAAARWTGSRSGTCSTSRRSR